jgi:translation initiation factor 5B
MDNQDAINAFLNKINNNTTSTTTKNKKKKKAIKKEEIKEENKEINEKNIEKDKPKSKMAKLALQRRKLVEEEEARIKAIQEEEERRIKEEEQKEEERLKKIEEEKIKKKQKEKAKIEEQKRAGTYKTQTQKEREQYEKLKLEKLKRNNKKSDNKEIKETENNKNNYGTINDKYKSIISCVLGHVDTGKTSLLDKIRDTKVQKGEVGGITQQIGATYISKEILINKVETIGTFDINVPGILMIDTPGHEAFNNLRKMGSKICNIAILVIDLVHGLEQQTIESMKILKDTETPFIIALNKIDRLYRWSKNINSSFQDTFKKQETNTQDEFKTRLEKIIVQIMEQGFNAKLYWENDSYDDTISICPISAITGEGLSDLLKTLITISQEKLTNEITYSDNLNCVLMETTKVDGYGITIDAILINGELKIGDKITINTLNGLFKTTIKNILTISSNKDFIQNDKIKASKLIKIIVNGLENAGIPSSFIIKTNENNENNEIEEKNYEIENTINKFKLEEKGVMVNASTMGSLEALVRFLQEECKPPIPISQVNIGKVMKKDVLKTKIINENSEEELKTIMAFNVDIDEEAELEAKKNKVKIFKAEIIYHLFDSFTKYKNDLFKQRKELVKDKMVFPCILKILPNCIFNKKNPLVFGVEVLEGNLHLGTELFIPETNTLVGKVIGIQNNNKDILIGKKSSSICIKINNQENPTITYGRQFDCSNILYSKISRQSLDILKEYYREDCTKEDLLLLVKLKKIFNID